MEIKEIKVGKYYWDSLHGDHVYCVETFDQSNGDDSYIKCFSFDGRFVKEILLPSCFVDIPRFSYDVDLEILNTIVTLDSGDIVPKNEYTSNKPFPEGTVVVLPGEGLGVVFDYDDDIDEALILSVSGGNLEETSYAVDLDPIYGADDYYKSKFKKRLEKNGFYYDEKFKCIFKVGDSKLNIFKYLKPPKFWDWDKKIASTITGGFTGKVVPEESSYFYTTLISVTSDGKSPIKIKFKTSDLRVPTEKEIEKFEYKIKGASEDAKKEIEKIK